MNRRNFVRYGFAASVAGLIVPKLTLADQKESPLKSKMAGSIYYTKDSPGRWNKKVGGHLPEIKILEKINGKIKLNVVTTHAMQGYEHYIVKHILLDKDFKFLAENMFNPAKDKKPLSNFTITAYSGPLYALSVCNKHDTWVNVIQL
jgi:superoxide reductase